MLFDDDDDDYHLVPFYGYDPYTSFAYGVKGCFNLLAIFISAIIALLLFYGLVIGIIKPVYTAFHYEHLAKMILNGEYDEVGADLVDEVTAGSDDTPTSLFMYNEARKNFYKGDHVKAKDDLCCVRKASLPSILHEDYDEIHKVLYDSYLNIPAKSYTTTTTTKRYTTQYGTTTTKNYSDDSYYYYTPKKSDDYYDVDEFADAEDFYDYYYDDFYYLEEAEDYYYEHS